MVRCDRLPACGAPSNNRVLTSNRLTPVQYFPMSPLADQAEMFHIPAPAQRAEASPLKQLVEWHKKVGPCCTQSFLAAELKISRQRVSQLVQKGRFETAVFGGETWVSYRSICDFMIAEPRPVGRPKKDSKK